MFIEGMNKSLDLYCWHISTPWHPNRGWPSSRPRALPSIQEHHDLQSGSRDRQVRVLVVEMLLLEGARVQ